MKRLLIRLHGDASSLAESVGSQLGWKNGNSRKPLKVEESFEQEEEGR
jgi:hypothetical protein